MVKKYSHKFTIYNLANNAKKIFHLFVSTDKYGFSGLQH